MVPGMAWTTNGEVLSMDCWHNLRYESIIHATPAHIDSCLIPPPYKGAFVAFLFHAAFLTTPSLLLPLYALTDPFHPPSFLHLSVFLPSRIFPFQVFDRHQIFPLQP